MKASRTQKPTGFTLVEIMIVVLIIGILLAIAIPNFVQARETSRAKSCVANLKQIDSAKQQYMMDKNASTFTTATAASAAYSATETLGGLAPTYIRSSPVCPAGGIYTTSDATTLPTCSLAAATPATYGATGTYPHVLR